MTHLFLPASPPPSTQEVDGKVHLHWNGGECCDTLKNRNKQKGKVPIFAYVQQPNTGKKLEIYYRGIF